MELGLNPNNQGTWARPKETAKDSPSVTVTTSTPPSPIKSFLSQPPTSRVTKTDTEEPKTSGSFPPQAEKPLDDGQAGIAPPPPEQQTPAPNGEDTLPADQDGGRVENPQGPASPNPNSEVGSNGNLKSLQETRPPTPTKTNGGQKNVDSTNPPSNQPNGVRSQEGAVQTSFIPIPGGSYTIVHVVPSDLLMILTGAASQPSASSSVETGNWHNHPHNEHGHDTWGSHAHHGMPTSTLIAILVGIAAFISLGMTWALRWLRNKYRKERMAQRAMEGNEHGVRREKDERRITVQWDKERGCYTSKASTPVAEKCDEEDSHSELPDRQSIRHVMELLQREEIVPINERASTPRPTRSSTPMFESSRRKPVQLAKLITIQPYSRDLDSTRALEVVTPRSASLQPVDEPKVPDKAFTRHTTLPTLVGAEQEMHSQLKSSHAYISPLTPAAISQSSCHYSPGSSYESLLDFCTALSPPSPLNPPIEYGPSRQHGHHSDTRWDPIPEEGGIRIVATPDINGPEEHECPICRDKEESSSRSLAQQSLSREQSVAESLKSGSGTFGEVN